MQQVALRSAIYREKVASVGRSLATGRATFFCRAKLGTSSVLHDASFDSPAEPWKQSPGADLLNGAAAAGVHNPHEYTPLYAVDVRGCAVAAGEGYKYTIVSREGRLLVILIIIIVVVVVVVVVVIVHVHALRVLLRIS